MRICTLCGTSTVAANRFCTACGAATEVEAVTRGRQSPTASRRPEAPGTTSRLLWPLVVGVLAVALAVAAAAGIWFLQPEKSDAPLSVSLTAPTPVYTESPTADTPTTELGGTAEPGGTGAVTAAPAVVISPAAASASSSSVDSEDGSERPTSFLPSNAIDGRLDTAWRPVLGDGVGEFLVVQLSGPHEVTSVGLVPGYAKVDELKGVDRFTQNRTIERVRWVFDDGSSVVQTFTDLPSMQTITVAATTTSIRIEIEATRPPLSNDPRNYAPISEVMIQGTG